MPTNNRAQLSVYWGTLALCILPAVFLMRGDLGESITMLSILVFAYFFAPNFIRYRKATVKFTTLIITTNSLGAIIYIIIMIDETWQSALAVCWGIVFFAMSIPVEKDLKKYGELE